MRLLCLLCILGCTAPSSGISSHALAVTSSITGCTVPAAIPNDGLDDRAAIQAALDTQNCAELEVGVYEIAMIVPRPPGAAGWGQIFLGHGDVLRGKGPATKLRFTGGTTSGDWYGLWVRKVSDVLITDLYIDTSALTHSNEQTHAIEISGPSDRVSIHRVWFDHPNRLRPEGTSYLGGDCLKIVGGDVIPVSAKISESWFVRCDRSGIASTGGAKSLIVDGNTFSDTGGQDVDFEASQKSSVFTITNNHTFAGPSPKGAYSMAIGTATDVIFSGNILNGRGLHLYNVDNVLISDSVINRFGQERGEPVVEMIKAVHRVTISNLQATRMVTMPGAVIRMSHHSSAYPMTIRIMNSSLRSASDAALIAGAAQDVSVINTRLERTVATPWACSPSCKMSAIDLRDGIVRTDFVTITGCTFASRWDAAVRLSGNAGTGMGAVTLGGNTAPLVTNGLYCPSTTGMAGPIVSYGNNWPVNLCPGVPVTSGQ